jgi:hypothetical protein
MSHTVVVDPLVRIFLADWLTALVPRAAPEKDRRERGGGDRADAARDGAGGLRPPAGSRDPEPR